MSDKPRIETGPVMFEDDWPGVFIRGDHAFQYATTVQHAILMLGHIDEFNPTSPLLVSILKNLVSDLTSCLLPMADQSKIQKVWRGEPPPEPHESPSPSDYIAAKDDRG
jgi:hypothetical protein